VSPGSDPEADAVLVRRRSLDRLRGRGLGAGGLDRGAMRDVAIQRGGELRLVVSVDLGVVSPARNRRAVPTDILHFPERVVVTAADRLASADGPLCSRGVERRPDPRCGRVVHEDAAHRAGGHREEMRAVVPCHVFRRPAAVRRRESLSRVSSVSQVVTGASRLSQPYLYAGSDRAR
jgi:hypothetical protein